MMFQVKVSGQLLFILQHFSPELLHWPEMEMTRQCVLSPLGNSYRWPKRTQHLSSASQDYGAYSCSPPPPQGRGLALQGHPIGLCPRPISMPKRACIKLPKLAKGRRAQDGKNSARKPCILSAIKPSNVDSEKIKFFKSDFTYNPQFVYSSPVSPQVLEKHNTASDRFLTQAVRIMELALHKYGTYEKFEQATGGNLLTKNQIWSHVKKYMEKEGCVGEIVVHVTDDLLSRASMTVLQGRPTLSINVNTAREHWLEGLLRHEIGTHYFRGMNNRLQPWGQGAGRQRLNLHPLNPTEEGLASIHSVLFRPDPLLWRAALLYYTVYHASRTSFSQLFRDLGQFVRDPVTRWDYCLRAKRGQTDTSQPGCFSKDQVYLDGILKILRYRQRIDFQLLTALGKVSYEDVERLKGLAVMEHVRIPHFLQNQARYTEQLHKIMEVNQLTDEELRTLI
uniref:KIAA0895 like n=1 Tax=Electrophorus electricus TaxID=8005 RepID=A0A4W4DRR0_ELEEL